MQAGTHLLVPRERSRFFEKQIISSQNKAHLKWTRGPDSDLIAIETSRKIYKTGKETRAARDLRGLDEESRFWIS